MRNRITILILLLANLCIGCTNTNSPEYVTREYLLALKDKDWEKAKSYTTKETASNLDMMKSMDADFGITEVKDIKCKINGDGAICWFCCSKDSAFSCIELTKHGDGKWKVHQTKEIGVCDNPPN